MGDGDKEKEPRTRRGVEERGGVRDEFEYAPGIIVIMMIVIISLSV